jgi:cytochrome c oxidase assembly protein subunit 15
MRSFELTPRQYARLTLVALVALTVIVLTGAAVRLTGSGLGCPDWPRCYGKVLPPLDTHALIEYTNRVISGIVGVTAVAAWLLAWRRRPYRRDLVLLGALLPLGVVAQAVLGGFTVRHELAPGYVMAHFGLSMLILVAAAALAWRARHEPGERPRSRDRLAVWAVRALAPIGAVTIFAGTAATAAGPHAGGKPGQVIQRLNFEGRNTLNWAIHAHGAIAFAFGIAAVLVWVLLERRRADAELRRPASLLCAALAIQGAIGAIQYETHLPSEIVWVHVAMAALTWLCVMWSVAAAGRLEPRAEGLGERLRVPRASAPT